MLAHNLFGNSFFEARCSLDGKTTGATPPCRVFLVGFWHLAGGHLPIASLQPWPDAPGRIEDWVEKHWVGRLPKEANFY